MRAGVPIGSRLSRGAAGTTVTEPLSSFNALAIPLCYRRKHRAGTHYPPPKSPARISLSRPRPSLLPLSSRLFGRTRARESPEPGQVVDGRYHRQDHEDRQDRQNRERNDRPPPLRGSLPPQRPESSVRLPRVRGPSPRGRVAQGARGARACDEGAGLSRPATAHDGRRAWILPGLGLLPLRALDA